MTLPLFCCESRSAPFVARFAASARETGHDLRLFAPAAAAPADYRALVAAYRHLSPNPAAFELAVFRRWFEVRDRVAGTAIDRFVVADSDLLLFAPPAAFDRFRGASGIVGSRGVTAGRTETDISPHFSFWTKSLIAAFCAFAVASYRDDADALATLYAARRAAGAPFASISDMTILARWVAAEGIGFDDSNRVEQGCYLDHNIGMAACENAVFRRRFDRKTVSFDRRGAWLRTVSDEPVRPLLLHFVGRNKGAMAAASRRSAIALDTHGAALAVARRLAGRARP